MAAAPAHYDSGAPPAVARALAEQAATLITCADSFSNDRRAALKRQINDLLGSSLVEEKSYAPY